MKNKIYIVFVVIIISLSGCFKPPKYPIEPIIEFARYEFSGNSYKLGDSGSLVIKFTDGDGDLGLLNGSNLTSKIIYKNLENDTFFSKYVNEGNIPQIPQKGTSIAIDGEIKFKFTSLMSDNDAYFITRGITSDTFTYSIYITDRANHQSNTIITPPIIVKYP